MKLETLILEFGADFAALDSALNQASQKAQKTANDIERALKQSINNTKLIINPIVDHKNLEELNKHIELKRTHTKSVQSFLNTNPITPRSDTSELKSLQDELTATQTKQDKIAKNVKRKVVKPATDGSELKDLQQEHQETSDTHEKTRKKTKNSVKPETDDQNLKKLQKEHKKTEDRHFKVRGSLTSKSLSASVNLKSLLGLQNEYANTILDHAKTRAVLNEKGLKVSVDTEDLDKLAKKLVSMASEETVIKARSVTSEQRNFTTSSGTGGGGGFGTAVTVELLSQILTATRESVQNRESFIGKVMSAPAELLKNYSTGVAYSYADIATRNAVKSFDREAGTDLYNTAGGFVGEFAGQQFARGKRTVEEHLATESGQKASENIRKATKESRQEMARLKQLAKEFYDAQDPQKAKELADQLLRASEALGKVATTPADALVNARKEIKSEESIQRAREQAQSVDLAADEITKAKRIVFVSGGFAGQKGESSKAIAESIRQKMGDGVIVVPIANRATDLSVPVAQNPAKWAAEAVGQPVSQGLSGVNEDSVSMLAAAMKARELNPNAQIDFVGYSGGGFVSEGATRLANQAGINNVRGVALATPGMVGTTRMGNFSPYIGEKDPLRLAEQALNPVGIARPNQAIEGIASHDFSAYIENQKVIEILNEEIDKLEENITSIPTQLELFDVSELKEVHKELVGIETQLESLDISGLTEVHEELVGIETQLEQIKTIAESFDDVTSDLWKSQEKTPDIISSEHLNVSLTSGNTEIEKHQETPVIDDKSDNMVSLFKQTRDLKSLIEKNPSSADIVKAQAQTDAIRKWFSDRYSKLKILIESNQLEEAKQLASSILVAKKQASNDLENILDVLKKAGQPTSIASGGVGASVQSAKGYLTSTEKRVWTAQETISKKELAPIKLGLAHQLQQKGIDTTTVGFKTLFSKAIEESAKQIASGGNRQVIEANLQKLVLSLNPVLQNKNKINGLGSDIVEGIKVGIRNESGELDSEMRKIALNLPSVIKKALDIKSPSRVMMEVGRNIGLGLIGGLAMTWDGLKLFKDQVSKFVNETEQLGKQTIQNYIKNKVVGLGRSADDGIDTAKYIGRKVLNSTGIPDAVEDFNNKSDIGKLGAIADGVEKAFSKLPAPIRKVAGLLKDVLVGMVGFNILEYSIQLLGQFAKEAFNAALERERLQTALDFSTGNAEESLARLRAQSNQLGLSFLSSAKNYQQFSSAVINTPLEFQRDKIFEGITLGLATRGAGTQQQDRALLAITQIASKGRVSMEELNQQLGEALPGALQIASRSMGLTSQEFIKLIESGAVLAEDLLPKLASQIKLESAGGLSAIEDTAFVRVSRFQNQIEALKRSLGEPLLDVTKIGLPPVTKALETLTKNGEVVVTVLASLGIVTATSFITLLKNLGAVDLALKLIGVSAASARGAILQLGLGLVKGLGWTALIYAGIEAIKAFFDVINAGSEESKRSLRSTKQSLEELARIKNTENPIPQQKDNNSVEVFKRDFARNKSLAFFQENVRDADQFLNLTVGDFNIERLNKFKTEIDVLREKTKDLKIQEIIASGNADAKKVTSIRQEISKTSQEIQSLTEKYFPQIGLIIAQIATAEERIKGLNNILNDRESSDEQKKQANVELKATEAQLKILKSLQDKYNESVKENLTNYQRLTEQVNKTARALSNIEFTASTQSVLSEINTKRQILAGNIKPFEMDLTIREQSLSTLRNQFNSLNGLLTTKEKELQNTLTDEINQRITDLMPELNGLDFRTALQQGKVSGESIDQRVQQLGDTIPFELKQVLETAKQQASIRQQTLNIDKSIVDTELEIRNIRRERARNARQAAIVEANVNERIDTLRQLPFGGAVASYRDAISEVRNQERLLQEAYRRLESASDDPNVIRQEVDNTRLALEQARANLLQQQRALEDYYRNLDRQTQDFNRQIEDYNRRVEDAQISAFRENRTIAESYEDLVRELDRNILNINNELKNIEDKIRLQQLKNSLIIPGAGGIGRELNNIILEYLQSEADSASEERSFESRTQEIEATYIASLRRIRDLHEQQADAERNRLRTIEDLKRSQEDLARSLSDLVRNTQRELGNTKNSLMAVNNEIVSIAPKIQSSGDILADSIKQVAENIKASAKNNIVNFAKPQNRLVDDGRNIPLPKPPQRPPVPRINNQPRQRGELDALNQPPKNTALNRINQVRKQQNVAQPKPRQQPKPKPPARPKPPAPTALNRINQIRDRQNVQPQTPPLLTSLQWLSKQTNPQTIVNGLKALEQRFKNDLPTSTIGTITNAIKSLRQNIEKNPQIRGAVDGVNQLIKGIEQQRQGIVKSDVFRQLGEQFRRFDNWFKDGIDNLHRFFDPKRPPRRRASVDDGQLYASGISDMGMYEVPKLSQSDIFKLDPNSRFEKFIPQLPELPPVPSLDFDAPKQQVETIKELEQSLLNSQKTLQELNQEFNRLNTLDQLIEKGRQIRENLLSTKRSIRDAVEGVADMILNAKGYLTAQEQIRQSAIEVSRQYRSQLETLGDQRKAISEQIRQNQAGILASTIALQQEGIDPSVRVEYQRQIETLTQATAEYEQQLLLLDGAISQVENNRGFAERAASDRIAAEKANEAIGIYGNLMGDLADRREMTNPLASIFGGGGDVLRITADYKQKAFQLNRDIQEGLFTTEQAHEMRNALQEIAEVDITKAFVDANPVLSGFRDLIKGAVTDFENLGQTALNILESIATRLLDSGLNMLLGNLFGGGIGNLFGGASSIMPAPVIPDIFPGATFGLGTLPFFAEGGTVGDVMRAEKAISRQEPQLVVAHKGEEILTTLNQDAQFWRALKRSGQWDELKANGMPAYAYGGTVGGVPNGSTATMTRTRSPIVQNTTFVIQANDPNAFRSTETQIRERMERRNREVNERYR